MTEFRLLSRAGKAVETGALARFVAEFTGEAIGPEDPGYDRARRIWNALIDRHPGLILRCRGAAEVVAAIRFARAHDILVAVRGGGHNVAGRAVCDAGMVIDLSQMRGVHVDPGAMTARVEGGATLGDLDRETHLHGLAVPTGVVSRTGIGGLTLGGGVGWLVRRYGPSCDNVLEFELVTAEGRVLSVSAADHEDLFWALRGGGGNFGVVTSILFRAHPVHTVLGGMIVYPREDAAAILRHYRDFMDGKPPAELTAYAAFVTTPEGAPVIAIIACWCGYVAEGERAMASLRGFGTPLADTVQPMAFPDMQKLLDGAFADGTRNYWKSAFIAELSDDAIEMLIAYAHRMHSPLSGIVIEFYAGPGGRVGSGDGAFAQRGAEYDIGFMAQWTDPAEDESHMDWARHGWDSIQAFASGGSLLNFLGAEAPDTVRAAYGASFARLAELKRTYDPENFFSLNQNIRAAETEAIRL